MNMKSTKRVHHQGFVTQQRKKQ